MKKLLTVKLILSVGLLVAVRATAEDNGGLSHSNPAWNATAEDKAPNKVVPSHAEAPQVESDEEAKQDNGWRSDFDKTWEPSAEYDYVPVVMPRHAEDSLFIFPIELGLRVSRFRLKDKQRTEDNSFLGTIVGLEEKNNKLPLTPSIALLFSAYFSAEIAYERLVARTVTSNGKSDGDLMMHGPVVSFGLRYPNPTALIPYLAAGLAFLGAEFDETAHWRLGYTNPQEYAEAGSPDTPKGGRQRRMRVKGDIGPVFIAGVIWQINTEWSVDAHYQYMDVESEALFISSVHGHEVFRRPGSFPMKNESLALGVKWRF